jgi:polyisoprenyl-phosphate glycosyltransferase
MKLSIIVPVHNSVEILPTLVSEIEKNRKKYKWNLQLILVDDSGDFSETCFNKIKDLKSKFSYITGIRLSRNFGQQSALTAGFSYVQGDFIAIIDDDLQDPPFLIQKMLVELGDDCDVVYGVRKNRKESRLMIVLYSLFYKILHHIGELNFPKDAGDFCVMKRKVLDQIILLSEADPYIRGMRFWVGFKHKAYLYERPFRNSGGTGWKFGRLVNFSKNAIFSFSNFPLKLILPIGIVVFMASMLYAFYLLFIFFSSNVEVKGFTTIVLITLIYGSLNTIFIGIIGEYLGRSYSQVKGRPRYIIDKIV